MRGGTAFSADQLTELAVDWGPVWHGGSHLVAGLDRALGLRWMELWYRRSDS